MTTHRNWLAAVIALAWLLAGCGGKTGKNTPPPKSNATKSQGKLDKSSAKTGTNPAASTGGKARPAGAPAPAVAPFDADQARKLQEAWASYLKVDVEHTNSMGMKFRLIPPGEFTMGSPFGEIEEALRASGKDEGWQESIRSEGPPHKVMLTQPIYIGTREVTQREYVAFTGKNPSHFSATGPGKDLVANLDHLSLPVENVSWSEAADFCNKLSQREELKPFYSKPGSETALVGTGYRLPTEAEWEFAARAGTITRFWSGDTEEDLAQAGWYGTNSGGRPHIAGERPANPFGLFDVHGNVWEWTQDWWAHDYYSQFSKQPAVNPCLFSSPSGMRVFRGGDWSFTPSTCRIAFRSKGTPESRTSTLGFRIVLVATGPRADMPKPPPSAAIPAATKPATARVARVQPSFSGKIVPEVAALFAKSPVSPLPAAANVKGFQSDEEARLKWWRARLVEPFEETVSPDRTWRAEASAFLDGMARFQGFHSATPPWTDLLGQAESLLATGCDDPLVLLSYGLLCDRHKLRRASAAIEIGRRSTTAFADSRHAPEIRFLAYLYQAALLTNKGVPRSEQELASLKSKIFDSLTDTLTQDLTNLDRQMLAVLILPNLAMIPLQGWLGELLPTLWARPDCDPWLYRMMAARTHRTIAWQARGSGFADTVTPEGWKTFRSELGHARNLLIEAWKAQPELPEAPTELIGVCMGTGGAAGETPRFWFDQAVQASFDHRDAYDALNLAMWPQWGGTEAERRAFALECLATKRYDTQVPLTYQRITLEGFNRAGRSPDYWKLPGIYEESREMLEGYRAVAPAAKQPEYRSALVALAYLSDHHDEAREYLAELGDRAEGEPMLKYGITLSEVRRGLRPKPPSDSLLGSAGKPFALAQLSPTGRIAMTVSAEGDIHLWRTDNRKPLGELKSSHGKVSAIALSPDSSQAAVAGSDRAVSVYDLKTRAELFALPHDWVPQALEFSPDGKRLAVGGGTGASGEVVLWELATQKPVARWSSHKLPVTSLSFSQNGDFVSSTSGPPIQGQSVQPGELAVWDVPGKKGKVNATAGTSGIYGAALSPDGNVLVVAGSNNVEIEGRLFEAAELDPYDLGTGSNLGAMLGHYGGVNALRFVGDRWLVSAGGLRYDVNVWDWKTRTLVARFGGHVQPVMSVAASSNGAELISLDSYGIVKRWPLAEPKPLPFIACPLTQMEFGRPISQLYFLQHEPVLAVDTLTLSLSLWKPQDRYERADKFGPPDRFLFGASAISPDGKLAVLAGKNQKDSLGHLLIRDLASGEEQRLVGHTQEVRRVKFSPDGKLLATGGLYDRRILLWDMTVKSPKPIGILDEHTGGLGDLAFSPNGKILASTGQEMTLKIWDLPSDSGGNIGLLKSRYTLDHFTSAPLHLAFSPDSAKVLVGGERVELWDVKDKRRLLTFPGTAVAFSPHGDRFATSGGSILNTEARLWETASGKPLARLVGGHREGVFAIVFSPDGQKVITGGRDGRVRCWDSETGAEVDSP